LSGMWFCNQQGRKVFRYSESA